MKHYLVILLSIGALLLLGACANSVQLSEVNTTDEILATLDSTKTNGTIAFYKGNPDEGGLLISEHSFAKDKTKESRETLFTSKEAAISAGADYIVMTFGDKRIVKSLVNDGRTKDGQRGGHKDHSGYKGEDKGAKNELKTFYTNLADNAVITIELFTADPSTGAAVVASFEMTKGDKSRDSRKTTMTQLKVTLEAANLNFKDITHKRLTSGDQSVVIESRKRGYKNHNHDDQAKP